MLKIEKWTIQTRSLLSQSLYFNGERQSIRKEINKLSDSNKFYTENWNRMKWERMTGKLYYLDHQGISLASQIHIPSLKNFPWGTNSYIDLYIWHLQSYQSGMLVSPPHTLVMAE